MPEPDALPSPTGRPAWRPSHWGPIVLIAGFTLLTLAINHIGNTQDEAPWGLVAFGLMFSAPMMCGAFAALGPQPIVYRWPLAATACAWLGMIACVADGDLAMLAVYVTLHFLSWAVAATGLRRLGWRMTLIGPGEPATLPPAPPRFRVNYLLAWMTVTALLVSLAKLVASIHPAANAGSVWGVLKAAVSFTGVSAIALMPVLAAGALVLSKRAPGARNAVLVLTGILVATLAAAVVIHWFEQSGTREPFRETWGLVGQLCLGASAGVVGAAAVLRVAHYRLEQETGRA